MNIEPYAYKAGDEAFAAGMAESYFTWFGSHNLRNPQGWQAWVIRDERGIAAWAHLEPFDSPHKRHVARVGVCVRLDQRGKGHATRLIAHVVEQAWALGYSKLWATYHLPNAAAGRAFFDNDFEYEGIFEREELWDAEYVDVVTVARFRDDDDAR
jgi:RimJ/RimL family protein N-acetyltransferase